MVDEESKRLMAQAMAAMNAASLTESAVIGSPEPTEQFSTRVAVLDAGGEAMKNILERFHQGMNSAVETLTEQAEIDPELKAALVTEKTRQGARVGSWEIIKHDEGFDVSHLDTGEPIARGLHMYEAAVALAKALNGGKTLTDEPVRRILNLNEQYSQHVAKASHHRHMAKKLTERGDAGRAAIQEDRFDVARDSALEERDRILKLSGLK